MEPTPIEIETKATTVEVSDLWKYLSAIGISCAISFGGHWLTDSSRYITSDDAEKIVSTKQLILENEMKHYDTALSELKRVVENNNTVMQGVKEELSAMRQDIKFLAKDGK